MRFFEKKTIIDFSAKENYISNKMEDFYDAFEILQPGHSITTLRKHQLEIKDSLFNPFDSTSHKLDYFQRSETIQNDYGFGHYFGIDNNIQVVKQVRYNFWMALGDIGGFYDGLMLLMTFFMAPISAILFENELLKDNVF